MKRSGVVRPWDKKRPTLRNHHRKRSVSTATPPTNDSDTEIPYVTVNGVRYLSDRFYLNKTNYRQNQNDNDKEKGATQQQQCTCGARDPPALFDRQALVASLDLQCAVLATFNVDKGWLARAFPTLFGPEATVPTLVLHDRRDPREQQQQQGDNDDDDSSQISSNVDDEEEETLPWEAMHCNGTAASQQNNDTDDLSIGTQPEDTIRAAVASSFSWPDKPGEFSSRVHFTQIAPTWLPPPDLADVVLKRKVLRERKHGVYHPKYMLLVEKSGSLVVVVSTANLTRPWSTDASWVQRFPAAAAATTSTTTHHNDTKDFGPVLHDFVVQQSRAACPGKDVMSPLEFWKRFAPHSIRDGWDYSQAQVDLIPHVPGDYPLDSTAYGRQRVQHLLQQRAMTLPRLSPQDRLIMQPTSLGADWTVDNMVPVMQSYLPMRKIDSQQDLELLERLDIVWPTDDWMQHIRLVPSPSPVSVVEQKPVEVYRFQQSCLFLSSNIFNRIHTDCLARMGQWEPTNQHPQSLAPPHFKSVSRLLHHRPPGVTEGFAWFILTSACLSHGAQGLDSTREDRKVVTYRNFELGVLFCSQRAPPMSNQPSRIYCYQPTKCTCQGTHQVQSNHRLIHLPLPYQCRPCSYVDEPYDYEQENEEVEDKDDQVKHFTVSPFFHEIPPGTSAVGNMLLTPYGKDALLQQKD